MGRGISMGAAYLAFGVVLGAAMHSVAIGIAIGTVLLATIGTASSRKIGKDN
jgi:hypothetical protein